ncbi:MAG: 3-deoxy-D-manno-octulosonic acid transferase [Lysobacterales bacterium]|jgi:3-deoxy-D-manno-octulosonic-acid transferase
MRFLYASLTALSTPFFVLYLALRGLADRRYWSRWGERFGFIDAADFRRGLLLHAASIGELNAAAPLLAELRARYPALPVTVTTQTPAGSARVRQACGDTVFHAYLPLDLKGAVRRFLGRLDPRLIIMVETEIWPNLYLEAHDRGVPLVIVNARLSAASARRFRYARGFVRGVLRQVTWIGAQSDEHKRRFVACGADPEHTQVCGNLKFDLQPPQGLAQHAATVRRRWGPERPVLVAGSTHAEDERIVIPAFGDMLRDVPRALLILAPRRPERFAQATRNARAAGLQVAVHSETGDAIRESTQCLLVDEMGLLPAYYACADLVFIGGSVGKQGGHNPLEAAALGKALLLGPNMENAAEIARQLVACGGAVVVRSQQSFAAKAVPLLLDGDQRTRMGRAALRLVDNNRGALSATLSALQELLDSAPT